MNVRTHPPRLILILGPRSAKDMVKAFNLTQLDAAFASATERAKKGQQP